MYRSYSVNDMPEPVRFKAEPKKIEKKEQTGRKECCEELIKDECRDDMECQEVCERHSGGILSNLKLDDIIIFAVILLLVMDNCDDKLLIIALGFLLFSDFFDF